MISAKEARKMITDLEGQEIDELLQYIEKVIIEQCEEKKYSTAGIDWSHISSQGKKYITEMLTGLGYRVESTKEKIRIGWGEV